MKKLNGISVILPTYNFIDVFKKTLNNILNQDLSPDEIIIVDSSTNDEIKQYLNHFKSKINIIYRSVKKAYPGEARNIAAKISKFNILAFIDSKTVPEKNWLSSGYKALEKDNFDIFFGTTQYNSETKYQHYLNAATFGNIIHETTPGSIIKADIFFADNQFIENVRTADDLEWRERLKSKNYSIRSPKEKFLDYSELPLKHSEMIYRYFIYALHTAQVKVQKNIKDVYFSLFFILIFLSAPRLNYFIGYNKNSLLITNFFKISFLIIASIILINFLLNIFLSKKNIYSITKTTLKIILLIITFIFIYNWNTTISNMVFNSTLWIPHITKIYISIILLSTFIYRGLLRPKLRGIKFSYLFPFNWLMVGIIGISLDFAKAPGYLLGSINYFFYSYFDTKKLIKENKSLKKILFLCPYPYGVQAGQRLKFEQHYDIFKKYYVISTDSFFDMSTWKILYLKGNTFRKIIGTLKGYIKRTFLILEISKFDVLYIHMWITPFGNNTFEKIYRILGKKIIYDIEDNVLIVQKSEVNPITSFLKSPKKYNYLIKSSDHIIASSPDLANTCETISQKQNTSYICASINTKRYFPYKKHSNSRELTIGWTGTHTTMKYLKVVENILLNLSKNKKFKFLVIGNFDYDLPGVNTEVIKWKKETEIEDLSKIDIGIYPLFEDEWVTGKSGLKALQYMALGIPPVSTHYGNITNIINNNVNGYLVKKDQEWISILTKLLDDKELRVKIGKNAIQTVKKFYSVEKISEEYLDAFKKNVS